MNERDFINQMDTIVNMTKNNKSKYIFVAPWFSISDDTNSKLNHNDKKQMMKKYSSSLEEYSKTNNFVFVDPNGYIEKVILENTIKYMVDFIQPNAKDGIELYSESIFRNEK